MAITPDVDYLNVFSSGGNIIPSMTYGFDFDTGEISNIIDGIDAIEQFIQKAIVTIRFNFVIYSDQYGCEISDLFGKGFSEGFIQSEIERVIREALIYDDRIEDVNSFVVTIDGDTVYITFTVQTTQGTLNQKVTVIGGQSYVELVA